MDIKGSIELSKVDLSGNKELILAKDNVITYSAADIMVRLVGGDNSYVPGHIGFMYGTTATPTLNDPEDLADSVKRVHTWDVVTQDASTAGANILVAPLILSPKYATESELYSGNIITIGASSGAVSEYSFPAKAPFADALPDIGTPYIYHALLLNRRVYGTNIYYTVFARVSLKREGEAAYDEFPTDFDLSMFWKFEFK